MEGRLEGWLLGAEVGRMVGCPEGMVEGRPVGMLGLEVGPADGWVVGPLEGCEDGVVVGRIEGCPVGMDVGSNVGMLGELKRELPQYLAPAKDAPAFDKASVKDYSDTLLKWWRVSGSRFTAWALAARIVFAISPNSASCERVFSLLERLFDEEQRSSLWRT